MEGSHIYVHNQDILQRLNNSRCSQEPICCGPCIRIICSEIYSAAQSARAQIQRRCWQSASTFAVIANTESDGMEHELSNIVAASGFNLNATISTSLPNRTSRLAN